MSRGNAEGFPAVVQHVRQRVQAGLKPDHRRGDVCEETEGSVGSANTDCGLPLKKFKHTVPEQRDLAGIYLLVSGDKEKQTSTEPLVHQQYSYGPFHLHSAAQVGSTRLRYQLYRTETSDSDDEMMLPPLTL
ncbi:hypothetical protein SRHO_G00224150 [Serrasalmus rhombeus]